MIPPRFPIACMADSRHPSYPSIHRRAPRVVLNAADRLHVDKDKSKEIVGLERAELRQKKLASIKGDFKNSEGGEKTMRCADGPKLSLWPGLGHRDRPGMHAWPTQTDCACANPKARRVRPSALERKLTRCVLLRVCAATMYAGSGRRKSTASMPRSLAMSLPLRRAMRNRRRATTERSRGKTTSTRLTSRASRKSECDERSGEQGKRFSPPPWAAPPRAKEPQSGRGRRLRGACQAALQRVLKAHAFVTSIRRGFPPFVPSSVFAPTENGSANTHNTLCAQVQVVAEVGHQSDQRHARGVEGPRR